MTNTEQIEDEATIEAISGVIEFQANGVVLVTAKPMVHELEHAREIVDIVMGIHDRSGRKVRLLVDMRPVRSLSREARLLYQSEEYGASLVGCALLIDSGISRVIGNFVIGLNKGPILVRLFTSANDANAWLESLPDE